jgi:hypothetical protein
MNFKFHFATSKTCTIILCGNALIYDYGYQAPFVSTQVHTLVAIKSRPQIPRGTKLVSLHEDMPREVNKVFAN